MLAVLYISTLDMDKDFHDLLTRYANGNCTADEAERIHRWYGLIEDEHLRLDDAERMRMRDRILTRVQSSQKVDERGSRKYFSFFVSPLFKVAASFLLLTVFGAWWLIGSFHPDDPALTASIPAAEEIHWENNTVSSKLYRLPDGSEVRLEPSAKLCFGKDFATGNREVYLLGKAFFDVRKDAGRPFHVYSGAVAIRVLGTSFFVDAPEDAKKVEVKVVTGKVSVFSVESNQSGQTRRKPVIKKSSGNGVVLSPNQTVEYFVEGGHWVTGIVEDPVPVKPLEEEELSFVFANTPIKKILTDINDRYGIEVVTENERIANCTFTGDVSRMTLFDMLDVISNSIGSTYEVRGTRILVSGKGCNPE